VIGFQQLGSTAASNADFSTSVTQFIDNVSWSRGRHSMKMGTDIRIEHLDVLQPSSPTGSFQFTNILTSGLTLSGAVVSNTGMQSLLSCSDRFRHSQSMFKMKF
jgi:hypothetical protein